MLAQRIAPDPARAGWLSGSRALVVMHTDNTPDPEGSCISPAGPLYTDCTERTDRSGAPKGANCTFNGCQKVSCVSHWEHLMGMPHLCAEHFDEVGYGLADMPR